MHEMDFSSDAGRAILAHLRNTDAAALASVTEMTRRLFALQSDWAPGLHFIGGEASRSAQSGALSSEMNFSLAGSGSTAEEGLIACLGECAERVATVERDGDIAGTISLSEAKPQVMSSALCLIECLVEQQSGNTALIAVDWCRAHELASGKEILVPADWCVRRARRGPLAIPNSALSSGVAAGPTFDFAAERALLELIERDASCLWWVGGRRGHPLALDGPAIAAAVSLLAALRQGQTHRRTWLLDITSDLGVPCAVAISTAAEGNGIAFGLSARLSLEAAARGAILEMCQMELGIQLAMMKLQQLGEVGLTENDRHQLARANNLNARDCDLLHPFGVSRSEERKSLNSGIAQLTATMAAKGIEVALLDLTRPDIAVSIVRAVAPKLQPMPGEIITRRLRQALSETGGTHHWTRGLPLM